MRLAKNIKVGKARNLIFILIIHFIFSLFIFKSYANEDESLYGKFLKIKILDKISSKTSTLDLKIGEEKEFKNLFIGRYTSLTKIAAVALIKVSTVLINAAVSAAIINPNIPGLAIIFATTTNI